MYIKINEAKNGFTVQVEDGGRGPYRNETWVFTSAEEVAQLVHEELAVTQRDPD